MCCLFGTYRDNKQLDDSNGSLIIKLGNLIKKLRNLVCFLLYFGIVVYHTLHTFFPLPSTYRYKDIYTVGNNLMSMAFFGLMLLYAHCLMYDEVNRYSKSVRVGAEKKEKQEAAAYKLDMKEDTNNKTKQAPNKIKTL